MIERGQIGGTCINVACIPTKTMVASAKTLNKTSEAIKQKYPAEARPLVAEVPFSSARKWSAVAYDDGIYALGAPEMLPAPSPTPQFAAFPTAR